VIKREQQRRRQAAALGGSVIQRHPAVLVTSPGTSHQPAGRGTYAIRALPDLCFGIVSDVSRETQVPLGFLLC